MGSGDLATIPICDTVWQRLPNGAAANFFGSAFSYGLKEIFGDVLVFCTAFLPKSGCRMFLMEYFNVCIVGSGSCRGGGVELLDSSDVSRDFTLSFGDLGE